MQVWEKAAGGVRKVSSKLQRHVETREESRPLCTIYLEFYSGSLMDRGDQAGDDLWLLHNYFSTKSRP